MSSETNPGDPSANSTPSRANLLRLPKCDEVAGSDAHFESDNFTVSDRTMTSIIEDAFSQLPVVGSGEIASFLTNYCQPVTDPADETYNVNDQHANKKWCVPASLLTEFFNICERMRLKKIPHGMSTRQREISRMFNDYDFLLNTSERISDNKDMAKAIIRETTQMILKDTLHPTGGSAASLSGGSCASSGVESKQSIEFHVLAMSRDKTTYDPKENGHKDGLHIYMDIFSSQAFRKYKIAEMAEAPELSVNGRPFYDVSDRLICKKPMLDRNSANVMPMVIGGIKQGGISYSVLAVYKVVYDYTARQSRIAELAPETYASWNIAAQFSPMFMLPGQHRTELNISPSKQKEIDGTAHDVMGGMAENEVEDLSIMNINDPQAREISELLPLLSQIRVDDYHEWMKILMMLARFGDKYKAIARAFSMQSKAKYNDKSFNEQWARSLLKCESYKGCGIGMLHRMAQMDDPVAYRELSNKFLIKKISKYIWEVISFTDFKSAHLGDFQLADIIHSAFPNRYIATPKRSGTGKRMTDDSDVVYYNLVLPSSPEYVEGFAYKYMEIMNTAPIQIYISQKVPIIFDQVKKWLYTRRDAPNQDERSIKRYDCAISVVGKAYMACMNHGSKQSIMKQFAYLSVNFKFERDIDTYPYVIGVYDGILEIGREPRIIRSPCDYMITRTSLAKYIPFDPDDPNIIRPMQWLLDFVPTDKFDKLLYFLIYICQVLSTSIKALKLLNITGGGQNAKTSILQFLYLALGAVENHGYAYRMTMDYLTQARTNSSAAQPELMPIQHARFVLMSEPGEFQTINDNKLKSLLSGESLSGRGLYETEKNIIPKCIFITGSNLPLRFNNGGQHNHKYIYDHGLTRRIDIMRAECKFTATPVPGDPLQKHADPRIEKEYIYNPVYQGALLSILARVYALFMMIHNEEIMYVYSPNIAKETNDHIASFDTINTFINKSFVLGDQYRTKLDSIIDIYIQWHNQEYSQVYHNRDLIRTAFNASKIAKYITQVDGAFIVEGGRALAIGEAAAPNDRRFQPINWEFKSYEDCKLPDKCKLPFDGKLKKTADARDFLHKLDDLYKSELAAYKASNHAED